MSCNCGNHDDVMEPLTNAAVILTKNDLYRIRTGRVIREHFHGSNLEHGKLTVFVTDEKHKIERSNKLAKEAMIFGDGIPIALTKQEIQFLQDGKVVECMLQKVPPVKISVMTAQTYHKIVMEQNKTAEAKLEESNPHYMEHVRHFLKFAKWEIVEAYDKYHNQDGGTNN